MRKVLSLILVVLLLCGCSAAHKDTSETSNLTENNRTESKDKDHQSHNDGSKTATVKKNRDFAMLTGMTSLSEPPLNYHYKTIVVDASHLTKHNIETLHIYADQVYGYVNIGTIKKSDSKYKTFKSSTKGKYNGSKSEYKVRISKKWRKYVYKKAKAQLKKGVDGLVLDRFDVYSGTKKNYNNLFKIIKTLNKKDTTLVVMNGYTFMSDYLKNNNLTREVIVKSDEDGTEKTVEVPYINGLLEDNVFTQYDQSTMKAKKQSKTVSSAIKDVINDCQKKHLDAYIVDYTKNNDWKAVIKAYCRSHDIHYYIAPSITLDQE